MRLHSQQSVTNENKSNEINLMAEFKLKDLKLKPTISKGVERTVIGVIGDEAKVRLQPLEAYPGVDREYARRHGVGSFFGASSG